jgi:hypothetical protein
MKWLDKAQSQEPIYDHDWFDRQDALFNARVDSLQAKCITEYEAKCLALKLYLRDYDDQSECHCFECQNLKGSPFFECVKGKPLSTDLETLRKCIGFIPLEYGELA